MQWFWAVLPTPWHHEGAVGLCSESPAALLIPVPKSRCPPGATSAVTSRVCGGASTSIIIAPTFAATAMSPALPQLPKSAVPMSSPALCHQHLPAFRCLLAGDGGGCSGDVFSSLTSHDHPSSGQSGKSKAVLPTEGCPILLHATSVGFPPPGWQVRKIQLDRQLFPLHQGWGAAAGQQEGRGHPYHPSLVHQTTFHSMAREKGNTHHRRTEEFVSFGTEDFQSWKHCNGLCF